jgi:SAM-dependent methyltransferase
MIFAQGSIFEFIWDSDSDVFLRVRQLLASTWRRKVGALAVSLVGSPLNGYGAPMLDSLKTFTIRSFDELNLQKSGLESLYNSAIAREREIAGSSTIRGYSATAKQVVDFQIAQPTTEGELPNWRETLICPITGLSNRVRAACEFLEAQGANQTSRIYCTEQTTTLYRWLANAYPLVVGSEFIPSFALGKVRSDGIRCEDLTQLSFGVGEFDYILSLDVFEHIPDYKTALAECARVLKPGGRFIMTAPFGVMEENTRIRAELQPNGEIVHHHDPVYHGDPMNPDGVLCFQEFGWDILSDMRLAGFADAYVVIYWSEYSGYLGSLQPIVIGVR